MTPAELAAEQAQDKASRANALAHAYHTCFDSAAGKLVLADLDRAFGPGDAVFSDATHFDPIRAAVRDGQRHPLIHIRRILDIPATDDSRAAPRQPVDVIT